MSRYAYPASQGFLDVSWHGSADDDQAMRDIVRAERKEAEEEELVVFRRQVAESETLPQGTRVLIVALPGTEDKQPVEEPPNEFERVARQGSWKIRDRATTQQFQEASELRVCPVTTRGMQEEATGPAGLGRRTHPGS